MYILGSLFYDTFNAKLSTVQSREIVPKDGPPFWLMKFRGRPPLVDEF